MTEQEILNEHGQKAHDVGVSLYRFVLPILEMSENLMRMMYLNREMAELRRKKALEEAEEKKKLQVAK